jgi:hypothetical protein
MLDQLTPSQLAHVERLLHAQREAAHELRALLAGDQPPSLTLVQGTAKRRTKRRGKLAPVPPEAL